jgi:hypothetical protein
MDMLLNELAFQKVLLASIDDTVQNRQAAEEEVRAEIRSLEKQIRMLKRCTTSTASHSQFTSGSTQPSQTQSSNLSTISDPALGKSKTIASAMDGYLSKCFLPKMHPAAHLGAPVPLEPLLFDSVSISF